MNGSHTTPGAGTGLGLTISQKLLEAMAGNIHVHRTGKDSAQQSWSLYPCIKLQ
ncbi:hypothetical protein NC997_17020 [Trichocoleus sp. DQ-A2]|uniref:hypothetical protein n=1 Tax=Trichocoleus sp. DQ-A2 TaxID=2933924 RepID=UPI0019B5971A|nr:hypothetical protein [Coleofasciculus sp. FACHB-T130]MBD1888329.1 hypothetical protein [Coleofasciculus sp. FACHB-SPT9]